MELVIVSGIQLLTLMLIGAVDFLMNIGANRNTQRQIDAVPAPAPCPASQGRPHPAETRCAGSVRRGCMTPLGPAGRFTPRRAPRARGPTAGRADSGVRLRRCSQPGATAKQWNAGSLAPQPGPPARPRAPSAHGGSDTPDDDGADPDRCLSAARRPPVTCADRTTVSPTPMTR